ncbi:MAG TPA: sugar phosphate nucleotidyltransferase [Myxococcales bacterium]|jgi:glucose-1-phosphate adenylyltransferase
MAEDLLAVVMAGGAGERLRPLTDVRAKPAVPFGGSYRIIDFALSNCINSGIRQVYVLTQYKSHSLSNHLKAGWNFLSRRLDQFIDEIPAQMQVGSSWYKGTADAIRQNMSFIERARPKQVLVLPGDHIYKMNYGVMLRFHDEAKACLSISVIRVPASQAKGNYGVLEVAEDGRVLSFEEKPQSPKLIPGTEDCYASMGVYIFNYETLRKSLANDLEDFGQAVIPAMVAAGEPVYAFDFTTKNVIEEYQFTTRDGRRVKELVPRASDSDYWRDVGSLDQYWLANLDLVAAAPRFNLYGERWAFFNCPLHFPPAKFVHESPGRTGQALNSIVADGNIISGALVRNSVLSAGIYIHSYALVENSVLMGGSIRGGIITETSIGRSCKIRNAIIDKNVRLEEGTVIGYDRSADERRGLKTQPLANGDYIVVVPKDTVM